MNYSKIGVRYAKALLKVAIENNSLEKVKDDLLLIDSLILSVNEFTQILSSPVIKPSEKQSIFHAALSKNISELSLNFINLLILNRREIRLRDIIRNFISQYYEFKGILSASFTTPISIDEKIKNEIINILKNHYNKNIELTSIKQPSIIGGFVLKVGDLQYDASVLTNLRKVKQELINTPLENK